MDENAERQTRMVSVLYRIIAALVFAIIAVVCTKLLLAALLATPATEYAQVRLWLIGMFGVLLLVSVVCSVVMALRARSVAVSRPSMFTAKLKRPSRLVRTGRSRWVAQAPKKISRLKWR